MSVQYTAIFHGSKNGKFSYEKCDFFAQNKDLEYTLEPPRWGGSNNYPRSMFKSKNKKTMYTWVNPSFTI